MKNRKIYFVVFALLFTLIGNAQVSVGVKKYKGSDKIEPQELEQFKKTTTVLILRDKADESLLNDYEKAFAASWKITPYKVVTKEMGKDYINKPEYSCFVFSKETFAHYDGTLKTTTDVYFYKLVLKNNGKEKILASIDYSSDPEKPQDFSATESIKPVYLKVYLAMIDTYLSNGSVINSDDSNYDKEEIKKLTTETLFLPDNVLTAIKYSNFSTKTSIITVKEEDLMKKYPYPYKIITEDELNEKLSKSDKPFYFVIMTYAAVYKRYAVFNSQTHKMIASHFGDMEMFVKNIKKNLNK